MFNRSFFQRDFNTLLDSYSKEKKSDTPVVEFHLRDGTRYFVERVALIGEEWISFWAAAEPGRSTNDSGRQPDQITVPYNMVNRVNFFPHHAEAKVGFRITR